MKIPSMEALSQNRRALSLVNLVLGFLLLVALLFLVRDVLSSFTPQRKTVNTGEKKGGLAPRRTLQEYAGILKQNPFGAPAAELRPLSAATGVQGAGAPEPDSDVLLIGTVAGKQDMSYAIFADKSGKQDVFRTGQKVFGAGTLKKVEPDRVVLSANHKEVTIRLTDVAKVTEVKAPAGAAGSFGRKTGESSYVIDQQKIQQALEKPDQIMTDARFVPKFADGRQQGFELREVKNGGIYQSLGLQNGDVLLRINEFTISNPETALQAVTALRGIDRAQLDILRNGNKMTMTYQIR